LKGERPRKATHTEVLGNSARACGSVFISGEYLILEGEAALLSAVNRYAFAEKTEGRGYRVEGIDGTQLDLPKAVCEILGLSADVLEGIRSSVVGLGSKDRQKYGLSSSAASCVALTRLLGPAMGDTELAIAAGKAHRIFQKGKGSNADIQMAVLEGSAVLYQQREKAAALGRRIPFPSDLRCALVWMASPAKTVSFIHRFKKAQADLGAELRLLTENNKKVIEAFETANLSDFLGYLELQDERLKDLGEKIGAPIHVPAHSALKKACSASRIEGEFVAKVSGSGGGDISLVFGHRDADWDSLFSRLPVEVHLLEIEVDARSE